MSANRVLAICFAAAVALEVVSWFMNPLGPALFLVSIAKYSPLVLLGAMLGRSGHSYRTTFAYAWPLVVPLIVGAYIRVQFFSASVPIGALRKAQSTLESMGWLACVLSFLFALPLVFALSALGNWAARKIWRPARSTADAA